MRKLTLNEKINLKSAYKHYGIPADRLLNLKMRDAVFLAWNTFYSPSMLSSYKLLDLGRWSK